MLRIQCETANAPFESPGEIPAILERVAQRIESGETEGLLRDSNGNTVGTFTITWPDWHVGITGPDMGESDERGYYREWSL